MIHRHSRILARLIAILGFLLLACAAQAFTLNSSSNSNLKGWSDPNLKFVINTSNCPANVDVIGLFNEAAKIWNNVATSKLNISYGGPTTSTNYTSPPTVYCETNFQAVTHLDQDFTVGAGAVQAPSGQITSGLLILNVSTGLGNISGYDQTKLKIILAHEIGHILGLGHADDSSALMYYDATAKKTLNLSQDDIDGITYLYPRDELNGDKPLGCALVGGPRIPPWIGPSALSPLLAVALVWLILRRRRLTPEIA